MAHAGFVFLQGQRILLSKMPRPVVGPTQPPFHCVPGFTPGLKRPEHDVYYHHLAPKLRMSGAIPLLPLYALMVSTERTLFFFFSLLFF